MGHPDPQQPRSHEVFDLNTSVVTVGVVGETTQAAVVRTGRTFSERVSDKTITGLKADVRLEGL